MISVVIPSYYSESTIEGCLQSLMLQNTEEEFEIIVVNSSQDETPQIIEAHFPSVRVIQLEQRVIAGTARNTGIQRAEGDILAFMDADCRASLDWLKRITAWHKKGYKAVGGSIVNDSPANIYSRAEYPLEILEFSPHNPQREVRFVSAANCSFAKYIFDRFGLFPEVRAGEDLVFCHKIAGRGEKIMFDPDVRVFHKNDINLPVFLRKQIIHGKYSFTARRMTALSGSFLNNPLILAPLLPFLPLLRLGRVVYRSLALKNKLIHDIVRTFPLVFLGCMMWSSGYVKGFIERRHEFA